jgi:Skp family chaperone for outer membrane proteins
MSDTPRTDEQINGKPCTRFEILTGDCLRNAAVPSEFARTLESELNAANDRIKRLEEAGDALSKTQTYDLLENTNWHQAKEAK